MKIVYRKKTGEVVMTGQQVENENLSTIDLPDDPKMREGYQMIVKDGAIEYIKPVWMQNQEKKDALKLELDNAKTLQDLKILLDKLIRLR